MTIGLKKDVVIFDVETTGFSAYNDEITEIALLKVNGEDFEVMAQFSTLIKIEKEVPKVVQDLTGITKDLCDKHGMDKAIVKETVQEFTKDCILVAHNAAFDLEFVKVHFDIEPNFFYDTFTMSRVAEPDEKIHKLGEICKRRNISLNGAHRAMNDVMATKDLLYQLLSERVESRNLYNHLSSYRLKYRPANLKGVV